MNNIPNGAILQAYSCIIQVMKDFKLSHHAVEGAFFQALAKFDQEETKKELAAKGIKVKGIV